MRANNIQFLVFLFCPFSQKPAYYVKTFLKLTEKHITFPCKHFCYFCSKTDLKPGWPRKMLLRGLPRTTPSAGQVTELGWDLASNCHLHQKLRDRLSWGCPGRSSGHLPLVLEVLGPELGRPSPDTGRTSVLMAWMAERLQHVTSHDGMDGRAPAACYLSGLGPHLLRCRRLLAQGTNNEPTEGRAPRPAVCAIKPADPGLQPGILMLQISECSCTQP